ncbi:LPXTG cell wall anchor domain-containing protein [Streptococcus cuniculi]|uniref:LPXTG cell wall anchor domain-containing protein n=1 Tax=Streptococcus cuniculi TaxID=1432788 RepID=UPI001FD85E93|nr:LPXTG cell wall anchor domain-containing protein [Streptococcus cuniculi]
MIVKVVANGKDTNEEQPQGGQQKVVPKTTLPKTGSSEHTGTAVLGMGALVTALGLMGIKKKESE